MDGLLCVGGETSNLAKCIFDVCRPPAAQNSTHSSWKLSVALSMMKVSHEAVFSCGEFYNFKNSNYYKIQSSIAEILMYQVIL